jgi:hypothetical protein
MMLCAYEMRGGGGRSGGFRVPVPRSPVSPVCVRPLWSLPSGCWVREAVDRSPSSRSTTAVPRLWSLPCQWGWTCGACHGGGLSPVEPAMRQNRPLWSLPWGRIVPCGACLPGVDRGILIRRQCACARAWRRTWGRSRRLPGRAPGPHPPGRPAASDFS